MKSIIDFQLRLIMGTIGMYMASWIFILYVETMWLAISLTTGIPVLLGFQVVFVVMMAFAYPKEWAAALWGIVNAVLELRPPMMDAKDLVQKVRNLLPRVVTDGAKTEYIVMQYDELCEVSDAILGNGKEPRSPVEELTFKFSAVPLDDTEGIRMEDGTMDGRPHKYPVIEAKTY